MPIPLGPFELEDIIGGGGMGQVWRGVHRTGVAVAVKVLSQEHTLHAGFQSAFRNEVRAVAALQHPNIVTVLDYGQVDARASRAAGGDMAEGVPYLAMELATGGSLDQRPPETWADIVATTDAVLGALAHAHGRGLVHRDVKPGNVLQTTEADGSAGVRLTDFGLAHALDESRGVRGACGTPRYMAPEQFRADTRALGPWTDLYAVGCVVYEWVSGQSVFEGDSVDDLARAHRRKLPQGVVPRMPVPRGLNDWLLRLLEKQPGHRFQRAADAAWALRELGEASGELLPRPDRPQRSTLVALTHGGRPMPDLSYAEDSEGEVIVPVDDDEEAPSITRGAPRPILPPMPRTWRTEASAAGGKPLLGAGLTLYGLRDIPLVDRDEERDLLWRTLRLVAEEGRGRAVVIRGGSGTGKSRLARWLCEHVHESGVGTPLRASHNPLGGAGDGVVRAISRQLHCQGLSGDGLRRWLVRALHDHEPDDQDIEALASLLDEGAEGNRVRFRTPVERWVLVRRAIAGLALERPVVLWLDDVQWGTNSLDFARHLLESQRSLPTPVLVVLTVRAEALPGRPQERDQLHALGLRDDVQSIELGPLPASEQAALVRTLLGLEATLAVEVERRTEGNPLFAVQLVGDWVERGVLEVGPDGFVLRAGETAEIPDDLHALWSRRLHSALHRLGPGAREALELAAVLGQEVDEAEWREVCRAAEVACPPALVGALVGQRLAEQGDDGWAFTHPMLRESIERLAREAGRLVSHHRTCASWIGARGATDLTAAARRARHLDAAGDLEAALDAALDASELARVTAEYRRGQDVLDQAHGILTRMNLAEDDVRRGRYLIHRAQLHVRQSSVDEAASLARQAEELAETHGWELILASALRLRALAAEQGGDLRLAESLNRRALRLFQQIESVAGTIACLGGLGYLSRLAGNLTRAADCYQRALALRDESPDRGTICDCLQGLGVVNKLQGDLETAQALFEEALAIAHAIGDRAEVASCSNGLGEIARDRGLLEEASGHYRRAAEMFDALGSNRKVVPRINLALVLIARRRYSDAREILEDAAVFLERRGHRALAACVQASLLPCTAAVSDWDAFDDHLAQAREHLAVSEIVDPDVAWTFEIGGQLAWRRGAKARSKATYELALAQWDALDNGPRADAVRKVLDMFQ